MTVAVSVPAPLASAATPREVPVPPTTVRWLALTVAESAPPLGLASRPVWPVVPRSITESSMLSVPPSTETAVCRRVHGDPRDVVGAGDQAVADRAAVPGAVGVEQVATQAPDRGVPGARPVTLTVASCTCDPWAWSPWRSTRPGRRPRRCPRSSRCWRRCRWRRCRWLMLHAQVGDRAPADGDVGLRAGSQDELGRGGAGAGARAAQADAGREDVGTVAVGRRTRAGWCHRWSRP